MPRATTPKKAPISKSDFIRSQPATLSASEVLAKAKAAGLTLTSQLVYKVRGTAKGAAKRGTRKRRTEIRTGASVPRPITTTSAAENLLRALAAEVGLGSAIEILRTELARVRAVTGR